jgi:hypothetical protein
MAWSDDKRELRGAGEGGKGSRGSFLASAVRNLVIRLNMHFSLNIVGPG